MLQVFDYFYAIPYSELILVYVRIVLETVQSLARKSKLSDHEHDSDKSHDITVVKTKLSRGHDICFSVITPIATSSY